MAQKGENTKKVKRQGETPIVVMQCGVGELVDKERKNRASLKLKKTMLCKGAPRGVKMAKFRLNESNGVQQAVFLCNDRENAEHSMNNPQSSDRIEKWIRVPFQYANEVFF